jgi:hypothetical protein
LQLVLVVEAVVLLHLGRLETAAWVVTPLAAAAAVRL